MSATPVDDHTEEFEQLAGLSALDVLDGEDLARFQQHAAHCDRCQLTVRLDRQAVAGVTLSAPEMDPSPDFKARLMRRAAQELGARPADARRVDSREPTPLRRVPSNVVPFWRRSPVMNALAAVLVLGLVTVGAFSYENQTVAAYDLSGSVPGSARVVVRRSGAAELEMRGVPDPEPGFVYEAWIIPPGQQPVPVDTTPRGDATINLPGDVRGSTVAITRERGRASVPTPPVLLAAEVRS
jgi:anti-sigma-K factor RskA